MKAAKKLELVKPDKRQEKQDWRIPDPRMREITFTVKGLSPLLVNNFDEKSKIQIEDAQTGGAKLKKAPRNPKDEFERAKILDSKGRDCARAIWFKKAMITAARGVEGVTMQELKQFLFVYAEDRGDQLREISEFKRLFKAIELALSSEKRAKKAA